MAEHFEKIKPRVEALKEGIDGTPLTVFVLGAGKGGETHEKRCQIRDTLNEIPGVQAIFPEEPEFMEYIRKKYRVSDADISTFERVQAELADLIIALEPAPGVGEEVAQFAIYPTLAFKLYDLLPEEYRATADSSYPGRVRRTLQKDYYTPEQFENCDIATQLCPGFVRNEQARRFLRP